MPATEQGAGRECQLSPESFASYPFFRWRARLGDYMAPITEKCRVVGEQGGVCCGDADRKRRQKKSSSHGTNSKVILAGREAVRMGKGIPVARLQETLPSDVWCMLSENLHRDTILAPIPARRSESPTHNHDERGYGGDWGEGSRG